ncbi:LOW QUALITY PROTEIN: PRAME family member 8-like [Meriones unguiculatus]|uniref:LOW QUALITY PROTEIN: PRAME family member 8-like n=1 Tax=Meriones unguiculatus TaxID=10047 RepID=UPI00293E4433|nr:LOW QUALITY PROTEIN: PRAME family member 8-like [Meriones unguiculatus]
MSAQTPPTLLKLARQALLRDETLDMSALDKLPMELLPALFKEALTGRHTTTVKAMVAAWPFPCLPVGALMKTPYLETFKAVLAGVDTWLQRKFHPRRGKLQFLDLRKKYHEFWSIWAGVEDGDCSVENQDEQQVVKVLPKYALRLLLKVVADLCLRPRVDDEQTCFLQWAQQRKGSIQFCCMKMTIWIQPVHVIKEVLKVFHPEHIREFELNTEWNIFMLAWFAPCLGQMRNLHKLLLAPVSKNIKIGNRTTDMEDKCINKFISQFSRFNCLQHLSFRRVYFLRNRIKRVLSKQGWRAGCLMTPLETLSITHYNISQSDLNYFSECPKLFQLKHLDMKGVGLKALDLMPLRVLLEKVADTLQSLDMKCCRMKDSHLIVLIPALSKCSQLAKVSFYCNDFSMPILRNLLQHTANLSKMNVEQYSAPLECYDDFGYVSTESFTQLCQEMKCRLRALRQPKYISFATNMCPRCGEPCVYDQEFRLCHCQQR